MNNLMSNPLVMSSLEIVELTGKAHSDVLKDIRRMLIELSIGEGIFSSTYKKSLQTRKKAYPVNRRIRS